MATAPTNAQAIFRASKLEAAAPVNAAAVADVRDPVPTSTVAFNEAPDRELLARAPPAPEVSVSGVLTATAGALEAGALDEVEITATTAGDEDSYGATTSAEVLGATTAAGDDSDGRTTSAEEVPSEAVTGQIVVEIATVTVVREIELAGQSVTVGAHLMTEDT